MDNHSITYIHQNSQESVTDVGMMPSLINNVLNDLESTPFSQINKNGFREV
jgi:hypothetical protein